MLFARSVFKPAWVLALALVASPGLVAFATSRHGEGSEMETLKGMQPLTTPKPAVAIDTAGSDADGNGVRDDVDAFIASQYSRDAKLRDAALRMARSMQAVLTVDLTQVSDTAPMAEREVAVMSCVINQLGAERRGDAEQMINRVAAQTYDTRARFEKREAFRLQASAADFSAEANCAADPQAAPLVAQQDGAGSVQVADLLDNR
ncbi:hypothetical protein QTH91_01395 [Variovorax dokdonensis]|uniref:Secreted protein n=1 Tax=Variovorax dokdonensis TaxID=344883 RepID=A0ABT7N5D2_9BURK|nr:hypothetical protein [Variovorax dokdonensis]MDM0043125.1 hypothetical protein [Variovorax dokdonensis]